jgi:hypothetical protein
MASVESAKESIWWDRRRMDAPGTKSDAIPVIRASRTGERYRESGKGEETWVAVHTRCERRPAWRQGWWRVWRRAGGGAHEGGGSSVCRGSGLALCLSGLAERPSFRDRVR